MVVRKANEEVGIRQLLEDLPRGQYPNHVGIPPNAYFESPENLLATPSLLFHPDQNVAAKIFLGVIGGTITVGTPLADGRVNRWVTGGTAMGVGDDRHLLSCAGTRSGKGRSLILPAVLLASAATSMLVIDPKGEIARKSVRYRADTLGQETRVFDPFDCTRTDHRFRCNFNCLAKLDPRDRKTFVPNARLIADALAISDNPYDQHWTETAKSIIATLCAHVATHPNYEQGRDLVTVWRLANELARRHPDNPREYWLQREMIDNDAGDGMVRAGAREFYDRTGGEFGSVLSNARKYLGWIAISCVQDSLRGASPDFRDFKRGSVYGCLSLPSMRMDALRGWLRLMVQFFLAAFEEEEVQTGPQAILIADEFHSLGKMSVFENAIAQLAGLGLKLWIVLQDLNQLKVHYEKNFETFIGNAGLIQVFGCNDNSTLQYISEKLGTATSISRSTNTPTFDQASRQAATGESWSMSSHPLMTPEEIALYFSREDKLLRQLILRPGFRPMITQRCFYDKHELFEGKYDD